MSFLLFSFLHKNNWRWYQTTIKLKEKWNIIVRIIWMKTMEQCIWRKSWNKREIYKSWSKQLVELHIHKLQISRRKVMSRKRKLPDKKNRVLLIPSFIYLSLSSNVILILHVSWKHISGWSFAESYLSTTTLSDALIVFVEPSFGYPVQGICITPSNCGFSLLPEYTIQPHCQLEPINVCKSHHDIPEMFKKIIL